MVLKRGYVEARLRNASFNAPAGFMARTSSGTPARSSFRSSERLGLKCSFKSSTKFGIPDFNFGLRVWDLGPKVLGFEAQGSRRLGSNVPSSCWGKPKGK